MKDVKKVLNVLIKNGYESYIVGGFVRDFLLSKKSGDVDICTSATPVELVKLYPNYNKKTEYGISFKYKNKQYEITTFRKEVYDNDRHPKVTFIKNFDEDLKRRDFTINTICMDISGNIIDKCGGINDLNKKVIKSLKDVDTKFREDPLRILRAIRFATVLNFKLDEDVYNSIKKNASLIATLSNEKIKEEIDKILLSQNASYGISIMDNTNISSYLLLKHDNVTCTFDLNSMYAQIDINIKQKAVDEKEIYNIKKILLTGEINYFDLFNYGLATCIKAGNINNIPKKEIIKLYRMMPIKTMRDINISSKEIMELLNVNPSKVISDIFFDLKKEILCGTIKNTKKEIREYILRKWKQ